MLDAGQIETNALVDDMERKVASVYKRAVQESEVKLENFLKQFEEKDKAMKLKLDSGKITESEYTSWRKSQMASGRHFSEMLDTLAEDYTHTDRIAMSIVNEYTPSAYAINRNYGAFEVEKGSMMDTSFTLYDRHTVERLIKDDQLLLPAPRVDIPKDKRWNKQHIRNEITQGVLQGESIPKIAKRLQNVTDMDKSAAIRNARTAVTGAQNLGRIDSYKYARDLGIDVMKEWRSTLDARTRHSHRKLDGERVNVDETFFNGLEYPGDPDGAPEEVYNCRCCLVGYLPGFNFAEGERRSELGDMSYEEWKNEKEQNPSYYKELDKDKFVSGFYSAEDVDRINSRFKQLDSIYHANVSDVITTLERDQREWDLYHDNYVNDLLEKNPRMRKSTAERRAIEVLGERPTKASCLLGGDYMFSTGEMTLNTSAVKINGGIAEDIARRQNSIERMERRVAEGKRRRAFGNVANSAESTFIHEYGHAIDATYKISETKEFKAFYSSFTKDDIYYGVSDYATTNEQEFIAECFTESFMGETQGEISKQFMSLLGRLIK